MKYRKNGGLLMMHSAVELTSKLVNINSENPIHSEKEVTEFICKWLEKADIPYQLQEVEPNRSNIIARVTGSRKRAPIILIAHCDTVPAGEGWTVDPFGGDIVGDKLYGRGSADMKSGLASALYALKEASKEPELPGDFIVVVSVDEEGPGMKGVMEFIKSDFVDSSTMVIAPEPTSLEIVRAHRGVMWYEIIAHGRASHGGHAERGVDANHALAEIICEIKSVVNGLPFDHPLLKNSLISIGKMEGGAKTNVVPDKARAEIDFRIVPPLDDENANKIIEKSVHRAIKRVPGTEVEIKNLGLQRPPVEVPESAEVIKLLTKGYKNIFNNEPVQGGYVAYTDAAVVSWKLDNKNAICFGPGNLEQAHAIDEWVYIEEIEKCAEIFKFLALAY